MEVGGTTGGKGPSQPPLSLCEHGKLPTLGFRFLYLLTGNSDKTHPVGRIAVNISKALRTAPSPR